MSDFTDQDFPLAPLAPRTETVVEWGFRLPEREQRRVYQVSEQDARDFVQFHPQCEVVRRTVTTTPWEPA